MNWNSDPAGGGSQFWSDQDAKGNDLAAGPSLEARVTPEHFLVDRSRRNAAPATKPLQLETDLPKIDVQQPFGDDFKSRYILKLVPRNGARPAAGCTRTPPPNITSSRLTVLVKMASEKNCYLEWQDFLASTATPLSSTPSSRIASQGPDVGQGNRNFALPMGDLGPGISSLPRPPGDLGSRSECHYLEPSKDRGDVAMITKAADNLMTEAKAAYEDGIWQTDASCYAKRRKKSPSTIEGGTTVLEARPGKATLTMAYFFSGVKRKASIAEQSKRRYAKHVLGLIIF